MKKYGVSVPIAGYVYIEVEAETEDEAIDKALDDAYKDEDIVEIEMYRYLLEGNVCNTYCTEASAEEIKDE